ncbi:ABC transporter substrate-binding protein [Microbacterium thalassium]|uniref:ABC-type branched-subunit amino acid transport system substrate-binding protein n=1 Tax=Microbacterium thalassium TaxID=362649 RepID=A0A7X0KTZ2_9MICO|nr:ABC transporter substrate-binding protein [Microbacterium thalassium]MBB6390630.1 ABC-type branched-subunit amino acid transport system substrate-binding protein [Microbacterium thalassium]GLK25739.1 amino acid-binding protein [Microbacterium thalassium]
MITTARGRRVLGVAAAIGIAAVALAGCARGGDSGSTDGETAASPGITDDSLLFGISTPLTGATAGPGNCTADGALAYFGMRNAEGGIEFGDGKTRTIEIKTYDDEYNPEKAAANFQQMVADDVFAAGIGLGTPTNRAWREAAIEEGMPQVLIMTGDKIFSTREESPWQLGLVPTYPQEGAAFGEALVASGEEYTVAALYQNDDYGKGYWEGFQEAVAGSDNITIVKELSYEPGPAGNTPNYLEPQITELAATNADVLFHAVSVVPRAIEDLTKADAIGWNPVIFLPSNTASPGGVLTPAGVDADTYPGVYAAGFAQAAAAPPFAETESGMEYFDAIAEYAEGPDQDGKSFPHCLWSWIGAQILEEAFTNMTEPTRESFYEALTSIDSLDLEFAFGPINTTTDGLPAIQTVVLQKFNGAGYANVEVVE